MLVYLDIIQVTFEGSRSHFKVQGDTTSHEGSSSFLKAKQRRLESGCRVTKWNLFQSSPSFNTI